MDKIAGLVSGESILQWVIIACIVVYFIYKEYPGFKERFTAGTRERISDENRDADIEQRLTKVEADIQKMDTHITEIDDRLQNDFDSLKGLKRETKNQGELIIESLKEREIIMRALLAVIGGLQEMGANGSTKDAQKEINDWLSSQAHKAVAASERE